MSKLIHVFFEVSMSLGHLGLSKIAESEISKNKIKSGFVVFINRKWTALKAYTLDEKGMGVLVHLKRSDNIPINPETIKLIPKYFNGRQFDYQGALREVILSRFKTYLLPNVPSNRRKKI